MKTYKLFLMYVLVFTIVLFSFFVIHKVINTASAQTEEVIFSTDATEYNRRTLCNVYLFSPSPRDAITQRIPDNSGKVLTKINVSVRKSGSGVSKPLHFAIVGNEGTSILYEQWFPASMFSTSLSTTTLKLDTPFLINQLVEYYFLVDNNTTGGYIFPVNYRNPSEGDPPYVFCTNPVFVAEGSINSVWYGYQNEFDKVFVPIVPKRTIFDFSVMSLFAIVSGIIIYHA